MTTDRPTEVPPPPPPDASSKPDPVNEPIGEQAMQRWDEGMDKLNAENLIALRQEQAILREQGNEDGAAALESQVARIPLSDEIKADPQGYLDSKNTPIGRPDTAGVNADTRAILSDQRDAYFIKGDVHAVVATDEAIARVDAVERGESVGSRYQGPTTDAAGGQQPPEPPKSPSAPESPMGDGRLGDVEYSYLKRTPVEATFTAAENDRPADALKEVFGTDVSHVPGMYDRRDIEQPTASAGEPTLQDLPSNDQLVGGVNRFYDGPRPAAGSGEREPYLMNCSACAKAVDARLAGNEPDAYAGYIGEPPGGKTWHEDAVWESTLESEWGRPIDHCSSADVEAKLLDAGPGARGVLVCDGHVANVLNRDGTVVVLDGQAGQWGSIHDYQVPVTGLIRTDSNR